LITLRVGRNLAGRNQPQWGLAMVLLGVFIVTLLIGQSISVSLGLLVERHTTRIPVS
jgi:hypothetical protein